jgi:hypothetical protein
MVQSSNGKSVAVFTDRTCILFLLMSSALLLAGCATTNSDERDIFYSGWVDPHSNTLIQ